MPGLLISRAEMGSCLPVPSRNVSDGFGRLFLRFSLQMKVVRNLVDKHTALIASVYQHGFSFTQCGTLSSASSRHFSSLESSGSE